MTETSVPPLAALLEGPLPAVNSGATLTRREVARFSAGGREWTIPCLHFIGPSRGPVRVRLGLFAGIHGDEPAGCAALGRFLSDLTRGPERAAGYELHVYPVVNPWGYACGRRENAEGRDLNREFWRQSAAVEVQAIEGELRRLAFAGVIALHADDTCEGHYGYAHGQALDDALLRPALLAAEAVLPRDGRAVIDGFHAREGVISACFQGVLSPPPEQNPRAFNLIFETPARAELEAQVRANVAALGAILDTYRGLISFAQGI